MFRRSWWIGVFALGVLILDRRMIAQMPAFSSRSNPQTIATVQGTVSGGRVSINGNMAAELYSNPNETALRRSALAPDGSFRFADVPPGLYWVRILDEHGASISEETVAIESQGQRLDLTLKDAVLHTPAAKVSVDELRKPPLSPKQLRTLAKAEAEARAGDHSKAVEDLRHALTDRSVEPYARALLGLEYLRLSRAAEAVPELEQATRFFPHDPGIRSNFGYALCLTGDVQRGEAEVRRALEIDGNVPQARFLMGIILLRLGSRDREAIEHLEFARRDIPSARLILAVAYARQGRRDAAAQQMADYLGPARDVEMPRALAWLEAVASRPDPPDGFRLQFGEH